MALREQGPPSFVSPRPGAALERLAGSMDPSGTERPWVWDVSAGEASPLLFEESATTVLGWASGARLAAVGDMDGHVSLVDIDSGSVRSSGEAHGGEVTAVSSTRKGGLLATFSWDHTLRLWDGVISAPVLELPNLVLGECPSRPHRR